MSFHWFCHFTLISSSSSQFTSWCWWRQNFVIVGITLFVTSSDFLKSLNCRHQSCRCVFVWGVSKVERRHDAWGFHMCVCKYRSPLPRRSFPLFCCWRFLRLGCLAPDRGPSRPRWRRWWRPPDPSLWPSYPGKLCSGFLTIRIRSRVTLNWI